MVLTFSGSIGGGYSDGSGATVEFLNPFGVVVDNELNVFVSDTNNHVIRKLSSSGIAVKPYLFI